MTGVDEYSLGVLGSVINAARDVLSDMEADDVPASLRRVTKSSARTLPPPFARSVVRAIVADDSFRSSVAEAYGSTNKPDEDLVAFLDDPEEGMARIEARATTRRDHDEQSELAEAQSIIEGLEQRIAEAKRRASKARDQHATELEEARSAVSDDLDRAKERVRQLTRELNEQKAEANVLGEQKRHLTDDLEALRGRLAMLVDRQERRAASVAQRSNEGRADATPSDPVELARWLDDVERHVRPFRESTGQQGDSVARSFAIRHGVRPDSRDAVDDLILQAPHRFILDGYNIGGEIDASTFSTRAGRDAVVERAARLARSTDAEVVIVFDGPDEDGRSGFRTATGVSVRFSRGEKADDQIAGLVASDPYRTVVITNDRELRDRCTGEGCVPIWSTAFLEWT